MSATHRISPIAELDLGASDPDRLEPEREYGDSPELRRRDGRTLEPATGRPGAAPAPWKRTGANGQMTFGSGPGFQAGSGGRGLGTADQSAGGGMAEAAVTLAGDGSGRPIRAATEPTSEVHSRVARRTTTERLDSAAAWISDRVAAFNEWWLAPGPGQYGPGIFDFTPDWSGVIVRSWIRRHLLGRAAQESPRRRS